MDEKAQYDRLVADIGSHLQQRLKLRAAPFATLVSRSRRHLPRRVYKNAKALVDAEHFTDNPRLSRTLDFGALTKSAWIVLDHLKGVDLVEQRKDRVLSILGSLALNLTSVFILLIAVLMWRGYL